MRFSPLLLGGLFLFASPLHAATTFDFNPVTKKLDLTLDPTNLGNVSGITVAMTDYDCTTFANGGTLTTDASGNFVCQNDDTSAGGGDPVLIDGSAVADGAGVNLIAGTTGLDMTFNTGVSPDTATFVVDPTEVVGSQIFSDASTDTMVWTWNRATGTDPTLTFGSGTVTGQIVAASTGFEVNGERVTDWTGTGMSIVGGALTSSGGSGNSFETIAVPDGTNPVADSSTDTLTLTETTFLTFTGEAATDTVAITQVTTDLGTDGLIAANAVALGTDTTNAYVADLTAGTYIDVSGGGAETANVTVTLDTTEIGAATFGTGAAGFAWTFDVGAQDIVMTFAGVGADTTISSKFTADAQADEEVLVAQGFSTQTANIFVVEQSDGTDVLTISNAGAVTASRSEDHT